MKEITFGEVRRMERNLHKSKLALITQTRKNANVGLKTAFEMVCDEWSRRYKSSFKYNVYN